MSGDARNDEPLHPALTPFLSHRTISRAPRPPLRAALCAIACVAWVLAAGGGFSVALAAESWTTYIDGTSQTGIAAGASEVWVSSSGGAAGFAPGDSTYERRYKNDGLSSQDLTAVARDQGGNLWYGSRSHGLQVESGAGRFLIRPLDQFDMGSDSVRVLLADGARVWAGTASGAALVTYPPDPSQPSTAVVVTFDIESVLGQTPNVSAIAVRADTTWFGTQRGIVRRDPDGSRSIVNQGLTDLDVRALGFSGGALWAGTASTVFRLENGSWVSRSDGLSLGQGFQTFTEFEGALHVGTRTGPGPLAYRFTGSSWTARATGLASLSVTGLAIEGGVLWAATSRGLHVLGANNVWRRIPSPDLPGPARLAFDQSWVDVSVIPGTDHARAINRALLTEATSEFKAVPRGTQGIENVFLSRILVDSVGRNWLGHCCCHTGTTCRLDRLPDLAGTASPISSFDLRALAEGPDGRIWAGSDGQGLYVVDPSGGQVIRYQPAIGLASAAVEALAFDGDGRLWIGYAASGVDRWTNPGRIPATITHFGIAQGLPTAQVTALATRERQVWVGTTAGVAVFQDQLLVREIAGSDLPDPKVTDLAFDGCGRVWVATAAGVAVFDQDGDLLQTYDDSVVPGLVDERVNGVDVDPETGSIWFATELGLSRHQYDLGCSQVVQAGGCTELCPFPNPFDPERSGALKLSGDVASDNRITILDALGRQVWRGYAAGDGTFWNGRDQDGEPVPSGVYLVQIEGIRLEPIVRRVAVRW